MHTLSRSITSSPTTRSQCDLLHNSDGSTMEFNWEDFPTLLLPIFSCIRFLFLACTDTAFKYQLDSSCLTSAPKIFKKKTFVMVKQICDNILVLHLNSSKYYCQLKLHFKSSFLLSLILVTA